MLISRLPPQVVTPIDAPLVLQTLPRLLRLSRSALAGYSRDRSRIVRQQAGDAAEQYLAIASLRSAVPAESDWSPNTEMPANDIETGILVARTQFEIVSRASQTLLAQANVSAQSVIELLDA